MDKGIEIKLDIDFHPGETLAEKLQEMGMSIEEFAKEAQVDVQYARDFIACKASVTPETSVSFELVTKIPAYLWSLAANAA